MKEGETPNKMLSCFHHSLHTSRVLRHLLIRKGTISVNCLESYEYCGLCIDADRIQYIPKLDFYDCLCVFFKNFITVFKYKWNIRGKLKNECRI